MAGFSGNPRIWSRLRFLVEKYPGEKPFSIYDRNYPSPGSYYITNIGQPAPVIDKSNKKIAFSTSEFTIYSGPSVVSRAYSIVNTAEDESVLFPAPWNKYGVSQNAQGLTVVNTGAEASPLWDMDGYTTPATTNQQGWTGEWSDDGTVFVSILRQVNDPTKVYMSVKQNGTTIVSNILLGIRHVDGFYGSGFANRKIDIRIHVRAYNDIWLFHCDESSTGAGNLRIWLSTWDGTTITSTTMLDTGVYDIMSFDALRGTTGLVYLIYALRERGNLADTSSPVNYRSFVRSIDESTKVLSGVLHTSPQLIRAENGDLSAEVMDSSEGDRLLSNRVFTYKGKNYLVHVYAGRAVVVYTYTDADPTNITLLRWGFIEKLFRWFDTGSGPFVRRQYMASSTDSVYARNTAIEYDPESDTAYLVTMVPCLYNDLVTVLSDDGSYTLNNVDKERVYITRHWQELDAPYWGQKVEVVSELPSYVFSNGTDSNAENNMYMIGYVPSRYGLSSLGLLFFHTNRYVSGSLSSFMHVVRLQNWHNPQDLEGEVQIVQDVSVQAVGARTYDTDIGIPAGPAIVASGVRNRTTNWNTYWSQLIDSSVDGEVVIDLTVDVSITGTLATTHNGEIEIDFSDSLVIGITGEVLRTFTLAEHYWSVGTTFLEDFTGYVNEERANVWGRPPIKYMGSTPYSLDILRSIDISQRHSDHMAETRWYAHGAAIFPEGWRTAAERISKVSTSGSENIQFMATKYESSPSLVPSTWDVYYAWKTSPPHYANMMTDWEALSPGRTEGIVHALTYTVGPMPRYNGGGPPWDTYPIEEYDESLWGDPYIFAAYFTDNFIYAKESEVVVTLTESWQKDALHASLLSYSWNMSGLHHLQSRHDALWSMSIHAAHESLYASRVFAAHSVFNTFSFGSVAHDVAYTNSAKIMPAWHVSTWSLDPMHAMANHELYWSSGVAAMHSSPYDGAYRVSSSLVALYGKPIPLSSSHTSSYSLMRKSLRGHVAPLLLGPQVAASQSSVYEMLVRNVVAQSFNAAYELMPAGAGATFLSPQSVATMNGMSLELDDCYISCDYDSVGYTFECKVSDLEFVRGARIGDRIDVLFEGTAYLFFLSNVSSDSPERSAAESVSIRGLSPVFLLDAPYAETVTYAPDEAKLFSEIIQEALGVPVDFSRHIDWVVPYGRAQSSSQTPLGLVSGFLGSIGSRLLSNPDGSVYALPRYPVGFDTVPTGVPPHALDETNHVFTKSSTYEYNKGYNRFRVRDSEEGYGDIIEYDEPTSIASVWLSPYRSSGWELRCTASDIVLYSQGEVVEEHEEMWDFKAGATSSTYPILDLVSLTWITDSLGGVSFVPYSTKVSAPVGINFGYGLAKVVYRAKRSKFELVTSTPVEATQLIIVEL